MARWTRKPPPGTQLDVHHAYCPDHCWPFLSADGGTRSLSRRRPLKIPPKPSVASAFSQGRKYGLSRRIAGVTEEVQLTFGDSEEVERVVPYSGGGFTILVASRKTDAVNRNSTVIGTTLAGTGIIRFQCPDASGTVRWEYGGVVDGTTRLSVAGLSFGDDLWVVTTGVRGMEIWQNGLLRASNAANPTVFLAGPQYFGLGVTSIFADLNDGKSVV